MIRPSWLPVFALKFLQKSMMFRPCGPSAVPTGGAGVALPAGIWSLTTACTFFALDRGRGCRALLAHPRRLSQFLDLQKIQLHRRRPAEDRHHHLQRVLVDVDVVDNPVEARERPFVDA